MRAIVIAVLLSACVRSGEATRERDGAGPLSHAPLQKTPEKNRCDEHKGSMSKSCADATYLGQIFVRRLATGDEVCLQGGFGDKLASACTARAAIVDTGTNRVLVEIREAKPDSKWFQKEIHQIWFEEGALVDLYLEEHGY